MKATYILAAAAMLLAVSLLAVSEAEARRGWRRARWSTPTYRSSGVYRSSTTTYRSPSSPTVWRANRYDSRGPVTYSGVSRAEQDYWNRRDAWYDHAYGGWRPEDFR
ncbi:hypothetical protein MalM25_11000 [Planctomycetes bacterium MalM25]|nr:hypothetical protein MalM25_11000 [Planctomycetes bacterium MalM25]